MNAIEKFTKRHAHGIHYALSIFIATAVLWVLVHELAETGCAIGLLFIVIGASES
jgi:hypothetical protein